MLHSGLSWDSSVRCLALPVIAFTLASAFGTFIAFASTILSVTAELADTVVIWKHEACRIGLIALALATIALVLRRPPRLSHRIISFLGVALPCTLFVCFAMAWRNGPGPRVHTTWVAALTWFLLAFTWTMASALFTCQLLSAAHLLHDHARAEALAILASPERHCIVFATLALALAILWPFFRLLARGAVLLPVSNLAAACVISVASSAYALWAILALAPPDNGIAHTDNDNNQLSDDQLSDNQLSDEDDIGYDADDTASRQRSDSALALEHIVAYVLQQEHEAAQTAVHQYAFERARVTLLYVASVAILIAYCHIARDRLSIAIRIQNASAEALFVDILVIFVCTACNLHEYLGCIHSMHSDSTSDIDTFNVAENAANGNVTTHPAPCHASTIALCLGLGTICTLQAATFGQLCITVAVTHAALAFTIPRSMARLALLSPANTKPTPVDIAWGTAAPLIVAATLGRILATAISG